MRPRRTHHRRSPTSVVARVDGRHFRRRRNRDRRPRVLLIGDSTLLAVDKYNGYRALRGFEYVYDAKSCRTLGIPSCGDRPLPPNSVEAISAADGSFDYVVIMAGYDEWWTSFPDSFDEVVSAARAKGAQRIIWLTYREGVPYELLTGEPADEAFVKNNQTLRDKVASGAFPMCCWRSGIRTPRQDNGWISRDGIHLTLEGALGVADYISRWIAFVEGRPCPMPTVPAARSRRPARTPTPSHRSPTSWRCTTRTDVPDATSSQSGGDFSFR